jgi:murein DD-endopeptidase MepM/ murein hydrolase activator NlpD
MAKPKGGLTTWFKENWVDISRKTKSGKHPPCGRKKARTARGGYPKCVPQRVAARMTANEKKSAVRRKRAKAQGVGGSAEKDILIEDIDDSTIMLLKDRVDSLAFAINIQKDSYNTIFNKIKSNETMYRHIPSISPVKGYIGSKYGYRTDPIDGKRRMHSGLDFPVNLNTDVVATGDGVVTKAQYDSGWGRYIKIDHGYGYETVYAHLWKINVKKGQKVKRGDKIGKSGNSGRAAGFHLHYEVHKNNKTVDPLKYFFTGYID